MGSVVDYFMPTEGQTFCSVISESPGKHYYWSNKADGPYRRPLYYDNHLGGSADYWPKDNVVGDNRRYLSFWGGQGHHCVLHQKPEVANLHRRGIRWLFFSI